jgi:hypothetical protein
MGIVKLPFVSAVSGIIAIVVGVVLALKAPFLMLVEVEYTTTSGSHVHVIKGIAPFLTLPVIMVILGALTFILALRRFRYLSLPTALGLGLFITLLTFSHRSGHIPLRVTTFGYPLGWLAWIHPPGHLAEPYIMGVMALPFLIDLAIWGFITWTIVFTVNRIKCARFDFLIFRFVKRASPRNIV